MDFKHIYQNSLIFDELENNACDSEPDLYKEGAQQNSFRSQCCEQPLQQQESNIYYNGENFPPQCHEKRKEKGRVLHLLKNFTQEMKQRWNMSDTELRIHNFLDENQVYITDPMQKQMDYYQKIKNQVISSVVLTNQHYSSDEDDVMKDISEHKKEMEIEELGNAYDELNAGAHRLNYQGNDTPFDENEEERDNPINIMDQKAKYQGTMNYLDNTISTQSSLNSQLSLQQSSIFVKRRQSKNNSLILQAPRSLQQQDYYEQFYYN